MQRTHCINYLKVSSSCAMDLRLDRMPSVKEDLFILHPHLKHFYCKTEEKYFRVLYQSKWMYALGIVAYWISSQFFGFFLKFLDFSGMRMYALGIVAYLQSAFNRFDCIVIFGSVFEELWINYGHRFVITIVRYVSISCTNPLSILKSNLSKKIESSQKLIISPPLSLYFYQFRCTLFQGWLLWYLCTSSPEASEGV